VTTAADEALPGRRARPDGADAGPPPTVGLLVNPIAGLGGPAGLKGTDGSGTAREAIARGARPRASARAAEALGVLVGLRPDIRVLVAPGPMGAEAAEAAGVDAAVVGDLAPGPTTAADTRRLAAGLAGEAVDLLLVVGGDGTARDVLDAIGDAVPVVGVPAGVKMHSAVFAVSPATAGRVAAAALAERPVPTAPGEVVDLDEDAYRGGVIAPRLHGYLPVPRVGRAIQPRKAPSPASETVAQAGIAADVVESMAPGRRYVLGPGTTTREVAHAMGVAKTLVGVDVVDRDGLVAADVGERELLELVVDHPASIVVAPIGGQGFLFGRGNQQIGAPVVRAVGPQGIIVIATADKLGSLAGQPMLVDTGDPALDAELAGPWRVVTGYRERAVYRLEPAGAVES
jgi:predicted polyphosphate/ATP-dependent NAD kinase